MQYDHLKPLRNMQTHQKDKAHIGKIYYSAISNIVRKKAL